MTFSRLCRPMGLALCLLLASGSALAQQRKGKKWLDMDYGPYLTASIESRTPVRNIAQKGIAIKLGKDKSAYVVFDTDLLRYSVGWTGDFLNFRGVAFDGSHGTWPSVAGQQIFGTRDTPGWAKDGDFKDPRKPYQGKGYGPLPHDYARYQGLYLQGNRVVLSYHVGGASILEAPSHTMRNDTGVFSRVINIGKSKNDLTLLVVDNDHLHFSGKGTAIEEQKVYLCDPDKLKQSGVKKPGGPSSKGLIAHWMFDEGKGTRAKDQTGKHLLELGKTQWSTGRAGKGLAFQNGRQATVADSKAFDFSKDFSITAWVKTKQGGSIASMTSAGKWVSGGKAFFVRGGKLTFDVGWVGAVRSTKAITDNQWHHVALTYRSKDGLSRIYTDGQLTGTGHLKAMADPEGSQLRLGYTADDFPRGRSRSLNGNLDDVRVYARMLTAEEFGVSVPSPVSAVRASANKKGVTWHKIDGSRLCLKVPANLTPLRIQIDLAHTEKAQNVNQALPSVGKIDDLSLLTKGGPPRWAEKLTTMAKPGNGTGPYVIDTITPPRDNPWKAWMRFGGFDFYKDGKRAAICTWSGDVWSVSGIDTMKELTWQRIATGMYQPLGLKVIPNAQGKEEIYVSCRDQITRLHDLNEDGEIDYYETFNNDHQVTEHFHEFAMDLQTDQQGRFYYAKSARHAKTPIVPHHGTLIRVSADGKTSEIICNGFRAANGVGLGPNGEMMTSDQEGHWTPANRINMVKKGGFYGNLWSYHGDKRTPNDGYEPPLVWLPKNVDRSPAEQLWVTSDKWGPLKSRMIHTSYGTGQVHLVMHETLDNIPQGGVVPIPGLKFPTGIMRGRFHLQNGQLYLCGLVGWSSNCPLPGGFYRIRYTKKKVNLPVELKVRSTGIAITFTEPLDKTTAENTDSYSIEQWNYRWSKNYGSKHYKVSNPKRIGQDEVDVDKATLSADGKTVLLEIEDLQPVMQMKIAFDLKSRDGKQIRHVVHNTINRVPK